MQALARNCRNQSLRWQGRSTSGEDREARLPKQSTGTDRSVLATKARNGAGAKGSDQVVCLRHNWQQEDVDATTDKPFNIDKRAGVRSLQAVDPMVAQPVWTE